MGSGSREFDVGIAPAQLPERLVKRFDELPRDEGGRA